MHACTHATHPRTSTSPRLPPTTHPRTHARTHALPMQNNFPAHPPVTPSAHTRNPAYPAHPAYPTFPQPVHLPLRRLGSQLHSAPAGAGAVGDLDEDIAQPPCQICRARALTAAAPIGCRETWLFRRHISCSQLALCLPAGWRAAAIAALSPACERLREPIIRATVPGARPRLWRGGACVKLQEIITIVCFACFHCLPASPAGECMCRRSMSCHATPSSCAKAKRARATISLGPAWSAR